MSRRQRLLAGTGIAYAHQAAVVLVGLWLTPFLLAHVGQHALGLWLAGGQILAYLALLELGVIVILPREVAAIGGRGDTDGPQQLGQLIAHVQRVARWQMAGFALVSLAIWSLLPGEWTPLRNPLIIVFAAFIALYPLRIPLAVLQGQQELPLLAKLQAAGWAAGALVTITLVVAGAGLYALAAGWVVTVALPACAGALKARGRWERAPVPAAFPLRYFSRSGWVSVNEIAHVLLNGSDLLLLGRMLGPAAIVPYACTGKLITVFANHPQLLMHAAQPALTELRASASRARVADAATALTQAMLIMSGALAVVILPINQWFVGWWVGPSQYGGWPLTLAFTVMMLLRHWNVAATQTLFCFGHERRISMTSVSDGVISIAAAIGLVWWLGPVGAPLASIIGVAAISLPANLRAVAGEMRLTTAALVAPIVPIFVCVIVVAGLASAGSWYVHPQTLFTAVVLVAPMAVLYVAAVLPFAWRGPLGPYLRLALPRFARSAGVEAKVV